MMRGLVFIPLAIATPAIAQAPDPRVEVTAAMTDSAAGWNAGDLNRFVAIYANDAVFVTPKRLLRSKAEIAEHYRPSFAGGGNKRGTLSFQMLAYRTISNVHQLLFARWVLTPIDGSKIEQGMTTLLFERRKDGWKIISDHSS